VTRGGMRACRSRQLTARRDHLRGIRSVATRQCRGRRHATYRPKGCRPNAQVPQCGFAQSKDKMCNHVVCWRCHCHWCFKCADFHATDACVIQSPAELPRTVGCDDGLRRAQVHHRIRAEAPRPAPCYRAWGLSLTCRMATEICQ